MSKITTQLVSLAIKHLSRPEPYCLPRTSLPTRTVQLPPQNIPPDQNRTAASPSCNKTPLQTKTVLCIPILQIFVAMLWWLIWISGAMYIVSQYGDSTLPHGPFTKDVAAGTENTPGVCTGGWPNGGWFLDERLAYVEDQATGQRWGGRLLLEDGASSSSNSTGNSTAGPPGAGGGTANGGIMGGTGTGALRPTLPSSGECNPTSKKCYRCRLPDFVIDPTVDPSFLCGPARHVWERGTRGPGWSVEPGAGGLCHSELGRRWM